MRIVLITQLMLMLAYFSYLIMFVCMMYMIN